MDLIGHNWFADLTDEDEHPNPRYRWQAFYQPEVGVCFALEARFATREECEAFIAQIPAGKP